MVLGALVAALTISLIAQAPPARRVVQPTAEVSLEARAVLVPSLPLTVAQARKDYGRVRRDLEASFREAERYLAVCTKEWDALGRPGGRITLSAQGADEARVLAKFLYDGDFMILEEPLLDGWNTWQNTLLARGLAEPRESQRMADNMLLMSSSKTEVERASSYPGAGALEILWDDPADPEAAAIRLPRQVNWIEILAVDRMNYGAHTDFGNRASAYADAQATELAKAWAPLTAHLNAGAAALLDLDREAPPTRDPGMRALRLMARIHFMERFRSTVWFCQVVWAHMASEKILPLRQM